jgi:uncharacterized protein (TIGR02270 family)
MSATSVIRYVINQHCDESAALWMLRHRAVSRPDMLSADIAALDERIESHLDGLRIARQNGWSLCKNALEEGDEGAAFAATVLAIESRAKERLSAVCALAEANPRFRRGLLSAFGWVSPPDLTGIASYMLSAESTFLRVVGVAGCALHRVHPGRRLGLALCDSAPVVRARALRAAGELGASEAMSDSQLALKDDEPDVRYWGAWAASMLGDRGVALDYLKSCGLSFGVGSARALRLVLQAMSLPACHELLRRVAERLAGVRWLIDGCGITGDPAYVPWLLARATEMPTARLAAEAFSVITGADLQHLHLEGVRPQSVDVGPTEDPGDPNVEIDPDEGLPWPDVKMVELWWHANASRFQKGTRYFMGEPVTREHCTHVLKTGYQRQRILAAHYLCLLHPGTPLFNTSAPAWRQQRLLATM